MRTCDGNGNDDDTDDDNVIVDNIEIMLIRCLVIEPGRSWVVKQKESASDNWGGTQNVGKHREEENKIKGKSSRGMDGSKKSFAMEIIAVNTYRPAIEPNDK